MLIYSNFVTFIVGVNAEMSRVSKLSVNRTTFFQILELFPRRKAPKKRQYERRFSTLDQLAIALMYMASTMSQKYMCFLFGGNESMISRALI